ncbi:MAG: sensor histidine kinase, partial [Bryobacteraceae bacterium]
TEQQTQARIQDIYLRVERNVYVFLAGMLVCISLITLYLIYSNRRLFESLATLSGERRDLARKLITMQEEVLRSISRELHDEFGQILTAVGTMLTRAAKKDIPASFKEEVMEVRDVAQQTLERVRSLSLVLHPSILDEGGLEQAIDWYIPVFRKQSGIEIAYEKTGRGATIPDEVAIHFYRVLQEALNNVAKHSGSHKAVVRVLFAPGALELEVRDYGRGIGGAQRNGARPGIGMVAMRERAALLRGEIEFLQAAGGGMLVRLRAPLDPASNAHANSATETLVHE